CASSAPCGTPIVCTQRRPPRTSVLARSVAPVKSSAIAPSRSGAIGSVLLLWQRDAREHFDHRGVVLAAEARARGLHEHLMRSRRQRQRKLGGARGVEHQAEVL